MAIQTGRVLNQLPSSGSPGSDELRDVNILFDADSTSLTSHTITINDRPYVARAFGLEAGTTVEVLTVTGTGSGTLEEPMFLAGTQVTMDYQNNVLVFDITGRYRFRLSGQLGEVTLVGHESDVPCYSYGLGKLVA